MLEYAHGSTSQMVIEIPPEWSLRNPVQYMVIRRLGRKYKSWVAHSMLCQVKESLGTFKGSSFSCL